MFLTTLYIIVFCRRCKVNDLVQNCLDLKLRSLIYNERLIVWHFGIEIIFQGNAKSSSREEKEKNYTTTNNNTIKLSKTLNRSAAAAAKINVRKNVINQ